MAVRSNAKSYNFTKTFFPFLALVIGSFFGLAQFRKLNYKYQTNESQILTKEQLSKVGMTEDDYQLKFAESLTNEYEEMKKKIDLENWKNIRGPRPWENSKDLQEKMRSKSENNK
jgi:cytochrome c oxidase assembly protein subunit 16